MKGLALCVFSAVIVAGCKKENTSTVCETNMHAVAGMYHLTKMEQVAYSTGIATDVTSTLSSCDLQAVYQLKTDSTITYTEALPCSSNGSGHWQLGNNNISISLSPCNGSRLNISFFSSWNCSSLVLVTAFPSALYNYRYTLTKFQ